MSDPRDFIKVHDGIEDHPKIAPLSDAAFRQLITSWGWCHRHNTDGRMPITLWQKRGAKKVRDELLSAGMVIIHEGEVEWHDYLEHQQSAAQRKARQEQSRSAGRAGGLARAKRVASEPPSESLSETQAEVEEEVEEETPSVSARDLLFEEFWLVYPRKVGKGHARKAWDRAAKKAQPEDLIRGAVRLARQNLEERFTPHAATWLNGERWLDAEPVTAAQGNPHTAWAREQG